MRTILIIDDDPVILEILSHYLAREGYATVTAPDGKVGLERFDQNPIDIVLCDLSMPGLGGLGVLAEVKKNSPLTPFVVFSGSNDVGLAVQALRQGAWDYILKPLPGLELLPPLLHRLEERAALLREKALYQSHLEDQIKVRTAQLRRQLKEKDLLLAEVHHRVKNNLQIILVLLGLQHDHSTNPAVREALEAHQTRIHALAMVQEEMHDPDNATMVSARNYGMGLIHHLLSAHRLTALVDLSLDLEDLDLAPGQAFTLGLVVNELMSCLSAAPTPSQRWNLDFELKAVTPGTISLKVTDSRGVWGPLAQGPGRPSLVWDLVSALASQNRGEVAWNPDEPNAILVRLA